MKKTEVFCVTFGIISACWLFVALAGGVEWGTASCGLVAAGTLTVTFIAAAAATDWL